MPLTVITYCYCIFSWHTNPIKTNKPKDIHICKHARLNETNAIKKSYFIFTKYKTNMQKYISCQNVIFYVSIIDEIEFRLIFMNSLLIIFGTDLSRPYAISLKPCNVILFRSYVIQRILLLICKAFAKSLAPTSPIWLPLKI